VGVSGAVNVGGAATFAGQVTISSAAPYQLLTATTGTNYAYTEYVNTGNNLRLGLENSSGASIVPGAPAYSAFVASVGARSLVFATNNIVRQTIDSTGAATFAGAVSTTNGNITLTKTGSDAALTLNGGVASYALATFNPNASTTNNFAILAETGGAVYFQQNNGAATKMTFAAGVNGGVTIATGSGGITSTGTGAATFAGEVSLSTAGTTISIKSGTNAAAGTVTLVGGAGTITSTAIDVNTVIVMTIKTKSGSFDHAPSVVVAAGSATIDGHNSDDSTYNWVALKVN
jgi:hypothetical protein